MSSTDGSLRDMLVRIGPAGLESFLEKGAGFGLRLGPRRPDPVLDDRRPGTYAFPDCGLEAEVGIEAHGEFGVVVQSVVLTNRGAESTSPIMEIDAFHLPLDVRARHCPQACGFGGGLTDGFYPPRAYRPEEVCFGHAREWVPEGSGFNRFWVGKGRYTLQSGANARSSNPSLPIMLVCWGPEEGPVGLWAALEWSGRWQLEFGSTFDWRFEFRGGPLVNGMILEPGESVRLPNVHIGSFAGNMQAGFNSVRRYVAGVLAPDVEGRRPRPVAAYNTWFGIHQDITEDILFPQADRAAELGLECFVVDAAWYGGASENFWTGVGNWERVDEVKFPRGLEPLSEYVRSKGMRFGLWFEPERAREGTDWLRQHPDWYWRNTAGTRFHLNLTERVVQDGLIEMLSSWISRLDIRWLRWDNNQPQAPFWDAVDPTGKVQFAYVEGLYRVFDTLLERHPNLVIDNCAGGGQRIDFGTLRRTGTMVISDHAEDPHVCRIMQTGGARVLPGNYMNSSVYVGEHDDWEQAGPLELISRMAGSITICGHIANWSRRQVRRVKRYLDGYRSFRHLLMKDFYPLTPYPRDPGDWDVVEFVDPETREAVVLGYRVRGECGTQAVRLVGLDTGAIYEVLDPFSKRSHSRATGEALMSKGLRLRLKPESAAVRHLKPL